MARPHDGIKFNVKGVKELNGWFERLPETVKQRLVVTITDLTHELYQRAVRRASGDVLKVKTGRYLRSLKERVNVSAARVRGTVRSSGIGRRAGLLEFGGKTQPRDIAPNKAKALHFMNSGAEIFAKVAHHPGSQIKPHLVIHGALDEMRDEITEKLQEAVSVR